MQIIEKTIEYGRSDVFRFHPLSDPHFGQIQTAEEQLDDKIKEIQGDEHSYWIGVGDMADCIFPNDKRWDFGLIAPWVEKQNIAESVRDRIRSTFKPIARQGICLLDGNHEYTLKLYQQYDMTRNLCRDLDLPYGGYQCFIVLTFKRKGSTESHVVTIHAWHGSGAATSEGAQLLRLKRLVKEFEADIFLMAHLHSIVHDITDRLAVRRHRIKQIPQIATITGSWLKGYMLGVDASYIERFGYRPAHLGCPCIEITPDDGTIRYISEQGGRYA